MPDKPKALPCDVCAGPPGQEVLTVNGATRWRVVCINCGHMTPHFSCIGLALAVWNERTAQREDKLADG